MNREQLQHTIRAACDISGDNELYIFGSQAIVGQYPDAHQQLRQSIKVDLSPKNKPEAVDKIDGALGDNSLFHQTTDSTYTVFHLREQLCLKDGKREPIKFRKPWTKIISDGV